MSEQEKKRQRIYDSLNSETKPNYFCVPYTKQRKLFFHTGKKLFKEKGGWKIEQKTKKRLFNFSLATMIKKRPTTSVRKLANELLVH